jgi:GT2 family glycosyltransferase
VRTAVVTIVAGRHHHLTAQRAALSRLERAAVQHVVVAMGAGEAAGCRAVCGGRSDVIAVERPAAELPLARARNAGAEHALAGGAQLLVFLDVDCIPGDDLLRRYGEAAQAAEPALLCGPVAYLPPRPPHGYPATGKLGALARPHPARPVPADGELQRNGDHALFWTLSFAVTADTWRRIGGFCEEYEGYGAEDTDYGQLARRAGVPLVWVGGAWAYHQHHPTVTPPVQHLDDILRNAAVFRRRWGWWPMAGWLAAFAESGLARHDPVDDRWLPTSAA